MTAIRHTDGAPPVTPRGPVGPDLGRDPFWRMLDRTGVSVMVTDLEGRLEHVNDRFVSSTGYAASEVIGQEPRFLKSGVMDDAVYGELWSTIRGGAEWCGELCSRRKDGTLLWEQMTVFPLRDEAGEVFRFVAVKEDISERKFQEREQQAVSELSAALDATPPSGTWDLGSALVEAVRRLFEADGAAVLRHAPNTPAQMVVSGAAGIWAPLTGTAVPADEGPVELVARTGQVYLGRVDPFECSLHGARTSALGHPLIATEGGRFGSLWLARRATGDAGSRGFDSSDARLLGTLAGVASDRLKVRSEASRRERGAGRLRAIRRVNQALSASLDPQLVLATLLDQIPGQLGVDACSIRLMNPHFRTLESAAERGFRHAGTGRVPVSLGQGITGTAALERRVTGTADRLRGIAAPDRLESFLGEEFVAQFAAPLIAKGQLIGALEVFHRSPLHADAEWREYLGALAEQAAIAIEHGRLFGDLQRAGDELALAHDATIEAWVQALERAGKEPEGHARRVTDLTVRLAMALGVPDPELVHLRRGALLHDIGKLATPDDVLQKPGRLTDQERAIMERHTVSGHEWLQPIRFLRPALDIPWCHHERMDGSGYPRGLKGDQIPLAARVFAVVDMWDALGTDRVYCSAWPEEKVVDYLRSLAGVQLDPRVVETFLSLRPSA